MTYIRNKQAAARRVTTAIPPDVAKPVIPVVEGTLAVRH